jgi:hypothetical protein
LFEGEKGRDRSGESARCRRDEKVVEAVEEYGYTQREVADFLGLHFASGSRRIIKQRNLRVPRIRRPFGKLPREYRGLPFTG